MTGSLCNLSTSFTLPLSSVSYLALLVETDFFIAYLMRYLTDTKGCRMLLINCREGRTSARASFQSP